MPINIELNQEQRLNLELLIGQQRGDVRLVSAYLRILSTLRLTEDEKKAINLRVEGNAFKFDNLDSNNLRFYLLETGDAVELKKLLLTYNQFSPLDLRWLDPVLGQLRELGVQ